MSLDQLDAPLRMTWTLGSDELKVSEVMSLVDRVASSGLFYLTLQGDFGRFEKLPEVLACLVRAGIQVSLVVDPGVPPATLSADLPVQHLLLECTELLSCDLFDQDALAAVVWRMKQSGLYPGLQLTPLKDNLDKLPQFLAFACEQQIDRVVLPNVPLVDDEKSFSNRLLTSVEIDSFQHHWAQLEARNVPKELVVHDLFLWEILCPEQGREHYSGCQAGNSLSHLDRTGTIYPCSAWSQPLGSLLNETLADIWQKPDRSAILAQIASDPDGCADCRDWHSCFGGCRGLSKSFGRKNLGRDLMCREKR